jgi:hypothetical protein
MNEGAELTGKNAPAFQAPVIVGPDGKVKAMPRKVQPAGHLDLVMQALA